jgi:hypothetical protein
MASEFLKLRRSGALRAVWLLPLLFLALEFMVFERPLLRIQSLPPELARNVDSLQLKMVGVLWAGFFHPLLIALLPALLFLPEHRFKLWRHLHTMPVPRRGIFLAKALTLALLSAAALALVAFGLWVERGLLARFNPLLGFPFHGLRMLQVLSWLWLGSVPLLALYLWVSDRINSLAVPVVFGLVGTLLTIALSGQELQKPWKRDLIPWVLSYFCAQQAIADTEARQPVHQAAKMFQVEPNVIRLPNGRKIKTWQNVPDEVLFPPPPPTPAWVLGTFSLGAGTILLGIGLADAGRRRVRS